MKKLNLLVKGIILVALFGNHICLMSQSKSCPAPTPSVDFKTMLGDWSGTFTLDGETHNVNISFDNEGEKITANGSLSIKDVKNKSFKTRLCSSNEIHLTYVFPNKHTVEFIGRPNGDAFRGKLSYKDNPNICALATETFNMKRTSISITTMN